MDFVDSLRAAYLGVALAVLLVSLTPPLRIRFLAYGPRAAAPADVSSAEKEKEEEEKKKQQKQQKDATTNTTSSNFLTSILDHVASYIVPHDYFWTFYFISCSLSAFWPGEVLFLRGPLYEGIASHTHDRSGASMSFEQVKITWLLLLLQGTRRLYESVTLSTASEFGGDDEKETSQMWVGHLFLGWGFYVATSIAVWVEGLPVLRNHTPSISDLSFRAPTLRTITSILLFILASGLQRDCHTYLAYLKSSKGEEGKDGKEGEYKVPMHPAFASLIAPHYTAECVIYLALAVVAAPQGKWMNWTLGAALVFVAVNLGVTATGTKVWYEKKFGPEAVKGKWCLIPFLY